VRVLGSVVAGSIEEGETSPASAPVNPQGGYQQTADASSAWHWCGSEARRGPLGDDQPGRGLRPGRIVDRRELVP